MAISPYIYMAIILRSNLLYVFESNEPIRSRNALVLYTVQFHYAIRCAPASSLCETYRSVA
jgi:hypothetical protein